MINSVRGRLRAKEPLVVVDVGAVGFGVHVSARTAAALPALARGISVILV